MAKAKSKRSAKRARVIRKGGRPRRLDVEREPNGRASRAMISARAYRQTIESRAMRHGLTYDQARDDRAGTVVGRLAIQELISKDQFRAAQNYLEVRDAYQRAIGAPQDHRQPPPEQEGSGDYEDFCERAKAIHGRMLDALTDMCIELRTPAPMSALDVMVVRDVDMPEMVGDLRLALNCLARHFFDIAPPANNPQRG